MDWFFGQWRAFADWTAGQPALVQVAIGSVVLLAAYLVFVLVLSWLSAWVRHPILSPPANPPSPPRQRQPTFLNSE